MAVVVDPRLGGDGHERRRFGTEALQLVDDALVAVVGQLGQGLLQVDHGGHVAVGTPRTSSRPSSGERNPGALQEGEEAPGSPWPVAALGTIGAQVLREAETQALSESVNEAYRGERR
ncbi:MAG: hypothetical protein IPM45_18530 [Acidimicrobiales bacterium]|nr:hypothetical protein [Acidimicrobiales bacterium]